LEKDKDVDAYVGSLSNAADIYALRDNEVKYIEDTLKEDTESVLTNARYGFVAGGLKQTLKEKLFESDVTRMIDAVVTNKYIGFPVIFLFYVGDV
jgi:hypothetical protein